MAPIIQWNIRGLRANGDEIAVLKRDFDFDILCLQETQLGSVPYNPGLNYAFYQSVPPPGQRAHGGTGIIINRRISHKEVVLRSTLQTTAIKVVLNKEVTICSVYLPPGEPINHRDLQSLVDELEPPMLILGDFNAHNQMWGSAHCCPRGALIEALIRSNNITLINDGSPTHETSSSGNQSAIDLSLCSPDLLLDLQWSVVGDLHGSDHFPILIKSQTPTPPRAPPKWRIDKAVWENFAVHFPPQAPKLNCFGSHIQAYDFLVDTILSAAYKSIPISSSLHRPVVPWWDAECSTARRILRSKYKKMKLVNTSRSKIEHKKAQAQKRRLYRKKKRTSWQSYTGTVTEDTPETKVWAKVRKLSGKYIPRPSPHIKVDGKVITNPAAVADILVTHFAEVSKAKGRRSVPPISEVIEDGKEYNLRFSSKEFYYALSNTSPSAPGDDGICYSMLKNMPLEYQGLLLEIYNMIWMTSVIPQAWQVSTIIPILKAGKDASQAASYRPIALTSCVGKLFEKMVNHRLVWWLETQKLLSPVQFGFRKNCSSLDPLVRLTSDIQNGMISNKHTIAVFFDLEKAYDTTWRYGILRELKKFGLTGPMFSFIQRYLSDRLIRVQVGMEISCEMIQEEGVPQGGVMSVILFTVAMNSVVNRISRVPTVRISLFVDDLAIYCTTQSSDTARNHLQKAVNHAVVWAQEWGFTFSPKKTVAVHFTRRKSQATPHILLDGALLLYEDKVKFLGMILDSRLTWKEHILDLRRRVTKSLDLLKVLNNKWWGADTASLLKLYVAICRSKLEYGCQIYSSASPSVLKLLDPVHNAAMRICTGAFRTSPAESMYIVAGQLPLDIRRDELSLRLLTRIRSSPLNPTYQVVTDFRLAQRYEDRPSYPKPLHYRMRGILGKDNFDKMPIKEVKYPVLAPWCFPKPMICLPSDAKSSFAAEDLRAQFQEHCEEIHGDSVHVYTDASKNQNAVGCAVVFKDEIHQARINSAATIFTGEAYAILQAIKIVSETRGTSFTIFSDSRSVLSAAQSYNPDNPLIREIQLRLCRLAASSKLVTLCWVPAHVGISGNEEADRSAKEALSIREGKLAIPAGDLKQSFYQWSQERWLQRWSEQESTNLKLKALHPTIEPWPPPSTKIKRRTEVVLTRLRIGHTHLTHKYLLCGEDPPQCAICDSLLTVEHILTRCVTYSYERIRAGLSFKSLLELVGPKADIHALQQFLLNCDLFYKI